jgi:Bacterial Ig-like domain (group 3)/Bacterial Ig domain/Pentapeptide repeats (8 copies)
MTGSSWVWGRVMLGRLLRVGSSALVIVVAFVTPVLATATATPASADTVVNGCTIVSNPTSTNFTNCPGVDLAGANLSGVDLSFANLAGASFIDCSVPNTNPCPEADVRLSNLSGADLSNANLSSAALEGTNLSSVNLTSGNLTGAGLVFCAVFPPAGSEFCPSASLTDATLTGATFTNATLASCGTAPGGSSACGAVDFTGTLLVPSDQTVTTTNPNGAVVTWPSPPSLPGATPGTCTPASGSTFPVTPTTPSFVHCQVLDDHGNFATGQFTVTVNGPPTTVSLTSSTNPSMLGQQVTFTATVSPDPGGGAVELFDNRTQTSLAGCSAVPLSGGSATCSTTFNITGAHDIQAFYGEWTSPILTQVVGPLPTTSVLIPSGGATVSGAKALLDAAASSPVGITSVNYELTGGTLSNQHIAWGTPTLYGYLAQWNTTSVPNGIYTLQSVATDVDGTSTTGAPITITVSNPPPVTAVLIPSGGATLSGAKALLDASASSAAGIASVVFEVTGNGLTDHVVATGTPTLYGYLVQWNTTAVPNGSYTLQSLATDSVTETAASAPITVTVNNAPPSTTVLIPSGGATQSGTAALLDASASANVTSVTYELTGGTLTNQIIATGTPTLYGWLAEWNTTTVHNGTYQLNSVASYAGGVSASSTPITITVSN